MDYTMLPRTSNFGTTLFFLILILSGTHNADVGPPLLLAVGDSSATSSPVTTYVISIKITNQIYNDTLKDPNSADYITLWREVESLFQSAFRNTNVDFERITQMTFSNGSVIANSTVQFGATEIDEGVVTTYLDIGQDHNPNLILQRSSIHVGPPPTPAPTSKPKQQTLSGLDTSDTSVLATIASEVSTKGTVSNGMVHTSSVPYTIQMDMSTLAPAALSTAGGSHTIISPSTKDPQHVSSSVQPHYTTQHMADSDRTSVNFSTSVPVQTTSHLTSPSDTTGGPEQTRTEGTTALPLPNTTAAHPVTSTANATNVSQITMHVNSAPDETTIATDWTASHSMTMFTVPEHISSKNNTNNETLESTTITEAMNTSMSPSHTITTRALSTTSHGTQVLPVSHNSSTIPTSLASSSASTKHIASSATQKPTSRTVTTQQSAVAGSSGGGVPGWGIALLVLAAVILLILLIFLILLVYFCCCRRGERGLMTVSDPTPYMPFNPDIPMYSTHTTIDLPNGTPYDDKPTKNRSGMYVVNPNTSK